MINTFGIPIIPVDDNERLQALYHYNIIDADVKSSFDNIAHIIADTFDVPIALISLVDKQEVIFKGNVGMTDVKKTSRGVSLCALAVLSDQVTVFENATEEPCLVSNPLVAGKFGLKFYAGAPLITKDGYQIGTVCIVDKRERTFSQKQRRLLERYSTMVMHEVELRLEASKTVKGYTETIEKQRNDLMIREAQLSLAQEMARMASWKWVLSESTIQWSPEMYKFWGFEEGEVTVTLDLVGQMTHPDDMGILQKAVEAVMEGQEVEMQYRRYDKSGNEIFIHTKTLIRKDRQGKPISVFGIDMDISALKAIQNDLQIQNNKLSQANSELASFNYIASHDLREPLRKIQTFSNRIADFELENFSERSQFYFSRIIDSAKRMEQLIDSLLIFSRVSNISNLQFIPIDLNEVISSVENLYSEAIVAKNAVIKFSKLPTVKGLPEQIEQVFSNIISNSLKYSKADTPLIITIHAEKIKLSGKLSAHNNFWKVDFQDNGIGFESKYKEKIFEVFQRLHTKNQFEGTGIGLAICKKIMQVHQGDIEAIGNPDQGASFTLYFPD